MLQQRSSIPQTDTERELKKRLRLTEKLRSLTTEQLEALGIEPQELE